MVTGLAMASWGWPFWLAILLAALATIPVSVLVGVASVRLKGLYLAIATLTFANVLGETFFKWERVTGGNAGWLVERPRVGPIDFASDGVLVLCLAVVLLLLWMVEGLRTSRIGPGHARRRATTSWRRRRSGSTSTRRSWSRWSIGGMIAGDRRGFLAALLLHADAHGVPVAVRRGDLDPAADPGRDRRHRPGPRRVLRGRRPGRPAAGVPGRRVLLRLLRRSTRRSSLILFLMFRPGGLIQVGRLQLALIRNGRRWASPSTLGIVGFNVGVAWLFLIAVVTRPPARPRHPSEALRRRHRAGRGRHPGRGRARSSGCSGRTAQARPRCSTSSRVPEAGDGRHPVRRRRRSDICSRTSGWRPGSGAPSSTSGCSGT